jgi:site-specific DNA recombinase
MLSNERYTGVYVYGRQTRAEKNAHKLKPQEEQVRIPGGMPRIIDDDTWSRAQDRLNGKKAKMGKAKFPYLFQGKVVCECGKVMHAGVSTGKGHVYGYYRCPDRCGMPAVRADKFDEAILDAFVRAINVDKLTIDKILAQVKVPQVEDEPYKEELKRVRKEIKGLVDAMKAGAHHQMIVDQLNELSQKERELTERKPKEQAPPTREAVMRFLCDMRSIKDKPYEEQRSIINNLIEHIKISKTGQITVQFWIPMVAGGRNPFVSHLSIAGFAFLLAQATYEKC